MRKNITKIISNFLLFFTPIRIALLGGACFFFWFLAFGDQGIKQLNRLYEMKSQLLKERSYLGDSIDNLTKEKMLLRDPNNVEMVIRKELGYIRPGEIIFEKKPSMKRIH